MKRTVALLAVVVALVAVDAVVEDPPPGAGLQAADPSRYPPPDRDRIAEELAATLEETGVKLTRATLRDPEADGYGVSATGTHLALYVEPVDGATPEDYVDGLVDLTVAFGEAAFGRWSGLESFDVCQEPVEGLAEADGSPYTVMVMSREAFDELTEDGLELPELLARWRAPDGDVELGFTGPVRRHPKMIAAAADAGVSLEEPTREYD